MRLKIKFTIRLLVFFLPLVIYTSSVVALCNSAITHTTPYSDFTINSNGTVTHNKTKLMWKTCPEGQTMHSNAHVCVGGAATYTWTEALQIPESLNISGGFASYTDWRLPNIKELSSIIEWACSSTNYDVFPGVAGSRFHWSSTPNAQNPDKVWIVYLHTASIRNSAPRDISIQVRLVRDAP